MAFHAALWDGKGLGYTAQDDRQVIEVTSPGVGIIDVGDLLVSAGSGFTSSIAAGRATIRNTFATAQGGLYIVRNDAAVAKQHNTPDPSNARVDQVFVKVYDSETGGDASDVADGVVIAGTASGSVSGTPATALDARTGVGTSPSNNYILVSDVYIPAAAGSAASFTYRDRRPIAANVTPPISGVTAVGQIPVGGTVIGSTTFSSASYQAVVPFYLPRRIAGVTKLRWEYTQDATTAGTGNYNFGIYDASGRQIVSTGVVALTGATSSNQFRSETIAATTFEGGVYYELFGVAMGAGTFYVAGLGNAAIRSPTSQAMWPNSPAVASLASGGTTLPTTLSGFTFGGGAGSSGVAVPVLTLSTT